MASTPVSKRRTDTRSLGLSVTAERPGSDEVFEAGKAAWKPPAALEYWRERSVENYLHLDS